MTWLACLLSPLSWVFGALVAVRASLYRRGWIRRFTLPTPVIVVGNITVGGTGKTPFVLALARALSARGFRPGVISRGYGGEARGVVCVDANSDVRDVGDEAALIARAGVPMAVGRDRVAAGRALLAAHPEIDVLVSDDGLQHDRLARTLEIALLDGERQLGNGLLLPAGPLREPPQRLARVSAVVLTAMGESPSLPSLSPCPSPAESGRGEAFPSSLPCGREVGREGREGWGGDGVLVHPSPPTPLPQGERGAVPVFRQTLKAEVWRSVTKPDEQRAMDFFVKEEGVHAVAGIGHPERFFAMLRRLGIRAVTHPFADHHRFTAADLALPEARWILMTEKDAVKCATMADERCWYLPIAGTIAPALLQFIEETLRGSLPQRGISGETHE